MPVPSPADAATAGARAAMCWYLTFPRFWPNIALPTNWHYPGGWTMPIFARGSYLLMGLFALLALGAAGAQDVRLGAALGPGAVVEVPEVERTGGEPTRSGVPTVVVFAQVKDCNLCEAVGHIVSRWTREYPNLQIVVVENRTARDAVEAWSQEHGLPVVPASEPAFRRAFDTNLTAVYLVDERGTVRDKVRPVQRAQWLALDRQLQRADRGDWEAVDANTVALPAVGGVARGSPSVPLGDGTPALVLVGDGFCSWCRQLVADGLKGAVGELHDRWPDLRVYLLEPSLESLGSGFYGSSTYDYGPREVFEEFVALFGEEAVDDEVLTYLRTGETVRNLPTPLWPDSGWAEGVTLLRYEVGGPDDPVVAWNYGDKEVGMLVFDGDGRYLGQVPFFLGSTPSAVVRTVNRLLEQ